MTMDIFFGPDMESVYADPDRPLTLIDVGARGGLQPNWRPARRHLRVVGFEPDPEEYARLTREIRDTRSVYVNTALHSTPGRQTLNVAKAPGTSSFLEPDFGFLSRFPDADRFVAVDRVSVFVDTLDNALERSGIADPDFLKLDTQGSELAILEGGRRTLTRSLFGVELEVQFGSLYVGQPRIGDLDSLLHADGFQLLDLRPSYWKRRIGVPYGGPKGQLVFADLVYFRTEDSFQRLLESEADFARRRSKLLRAMTCSLLYGYVDYALALLEPNLPLFQPEVGARLQHSLRTDIRLSYRMPHFRGRGMLSQLFYRLHRMLFPTVGGWASGGRHLGNLD